MSPSSSKVCIQMSKQKTCSNADVNYKCTPITKLLHLRPVESGSESVVGDHNSQMRSNLLETVVNQAGRGIGTSRIA